ncbi:type I restriction-modification system subunit M [uncultured Methanobrevibacter sp.]|uniref:type I restriction-modification system subunit M n=1 Tax=uncultured Methanobrevibacter sp. TaxID=253161 RepID=UPI0025EDBEAB|nr:type I restriction-modification system subunit M [uncultured Methanobrevibacter sp.]
MNESKFIELIFDTINEFQGKLSIGEYKIIILNLIFLKYVSDEFEIKNQELLDEGMGFEDDIDEYTSENIFYMPLKARWEFISKKTYSEENGYTIDNAMKLIEDANPQLKGIFSKNFGNPEIDKKHLGELIDLFNNISFNDYSPNERFWSNIYETCLYRFFQAEGKKSSESYTPIGIIKVLVNILKPNAGRVYDPCCGTGGMFIQLDKFLENQNIPIQNFSFYGQEINNDRWKLSKLNTIIHKLDVDIGSYSSDTLRTDIHPLIKADYILANPKFNMDKWGFEELQDSPMWKYGIPPKGNANFAWIQYMIYHLSPKGKIGLVLANGSLSSKGKIRQAIIEDDLVECIVALPTQLFYAGGIPVSLWFLNKAKKQKGKTLFIDASKMGTMVSRKLRELTDEDIELIADTFTKFEEGTLDDEKGFCKVSDLEEIKKHEFILTPGRYVGFKPEKDDGIPFKEKMNKLTTELYDLMDESEAQNKKIKKILNEIEFK